VATNVNPGWRPAQTGRFLRLDAVRDVRAHGKKVIVNGELWLTAPSASFARRIAEELRRLAKLPNQERDQAVPELIRASFDERAVAQRCQDFQKTIPQLALVEQRAARLSVRFRAGPHLGILASNCPGSVWSLDSLRSPRRPQCYSIEHTARFTPMPKTNASPMPLTIALAPTSALRARDALSRPLVEMFHPLAVAKVLLPEARFREFARRVLLDIRHPALPLCPSDDPAQRATELRARTSLRQAAEQLLKRTASSRANCAPARASG